MKRTSGSSYIALFDLATNNSKPTTFPPYDIAQIVNGDSTRYRIDIAVAGYQRSDLDVQVHQQKLYVSGEVSNPQDENETVIHKGIAGRKFKLQFQLGEYVTVNYADLRNGILSIDLKEIIPESQKAQKIFISGP